MDHCWFSTNWACVEKGGETGAGELSSAVDERLRKFINYAHCLGYFVARAHADFISTDQAEDVASVIRASN